MQDRSAINEKFALSIKTFKLLIYKCTFNFKNILDYTLHHNFVKKRSQILCNSYAQLRD